MRLLFISDNFPPEVNAPATRTWEHCLEWVKDGIDVTVITCFPNFPEGKIFRGYRNKLYSIEFLEGIRIVRVFTYITANKGFIKRTIDYISFGVAACVSGLFVKTDLIVATSPQFFAAVWARRLAFVKRRPWVMEVRDLWPESVKSVGAISNEWLLVYFRWLELRLYRSASCIVTLTDSFKEHISSRGIDPAKVFVIKNGANLALFRPKEKNLILSDKLGLDGKFVVGFIGTLGMAHKLDFIIEAASKIRDPDIHFLFIGAGAERENLEAIIKKAKPLNVSMYGMIPKDQVPDYLSIVDVSLINLRKSENFKTVLPSKIFESSAMGKPILLGVDGEARKLVELYSAGIFFEPENEAEFISKLLLLRNDNSLYDNMKSGCRKLAADFDRKRLAREMKELLKEVEGKSQNRKKAKYYNN